ncbi:MAG: twin-arginine translocase TatA/TatE family subunit [Mobilicoccus sp.]|nr:twin-arginine translocase TatA/TatE family subunit [Mobilicoccus sp.]
MHPTEILVIVVLAFILIGPERLPEVLAKTRRFIREARKMADGARTQLRDQMGPEFDDIDWKSYDPRQYDPRRIVREALLEPYDDDDDDDDSKDEKRREEPARRAAAVYDPSRPVPFDTDAT